MQDRLANSTKNVLADIKPLILQGAILELSFQLESYSVPTGNGGTRQAPAYLLDFDATLTLVTGYNAKLRAAVIKRWRELEEEVMKPAVPALPRNYTEALRELLHTVEQKEELEAEKLQLTYELGEAAPKVDYVDNVLGQSIGKTPLSDFGKALKSDGLATGGRKIFKQLRALGIIWRSDKPYEKYVEAGYLEYNVKGSVFGEVAMTFVTDKGKPWVVSKVREAIALGY